jgi:hypothetical protein
MTEAEWLACADPDPMLEFLGDKTSDRTARLFACACCRRIWHCLEPRERELVELAERVAEGEEGLPSEDLGEAYSVGEAAAMCTLSPDARVAAGGAAEYASDQVGLDAAGEAAFNDYAPRILAERRLQADFLRCIFGNPFRPVTVDPAWLAWNGGTIPKLAEAVYQERAFERLPVLADALEEAGCSEADLLGHLRSPGPHVRGCWAVDLLLGKG